MSEFIGRQKAVGLAIEGVRGTAESVASKWLRKTTADILPQVEKVVDESSFGGLEESTTARRVKHWHEGTLEGNLHADAIGYIFANIYGEVDTAVVEAGEVFEHTFELEQTILHPTLSMFIKNPVKQEVYNGGVVSALEISADMDSIVSYSATIMAKEGSSNADTVTYDKEYDFVGRDITIKLADTEAGLTGATPIKAKTLTINWDTGAIADYVFGDDTPNEIYNGRMAIDISFERNYTDTTFEDLYKADTSKYMSITIQGDDVLEDDNAPTLTVILNKVQVMENPVTDGNDELATETVTLKAFKNETDDEQSKVILQNVTESYVVGS
jgi:hypothetical protein